MSDVTPYSLEQQRRILRIARAAVAASLEGHRYEALIEPHEHYLLEPRGCFVTLHHERGHLRGCIGTFRADSPLGHTVADIAHSVVHDPRFVDDPVVSPELEQLVIDVSVLTPMQKIEDPRKMRIGVDGIHIAGRRFGRRVSGCLLPQVAVEQGWTAEQTLSYCCKHKMGLDAQAWHPPTKLEFHVFQSIIVDERAVEGRGGHE
jgi:hypothetical protein